MPSPQPLQVDVIAQVARSMQRLAPEARHVLVGVSGGADSVTALVALQGCGLKVSAGHFDHRLREGSADDADFVRSLCDDLGVRLFQGAADVTAIASARGWNLEDGARRLRYEFLHRAAKGAGADVVATGHTRDDQAETLLMQLLRGSALARGMAPRRGRLVRPLLDVAHASTLGFVEAGGWGHREDASNQDRRRTRAWLRHEVLPLLESRFPGAVERLAHAAATAADADEALRHYARLTFAEPPLSALALLRAPRAVRRMAIAGLLEDAAATVTRSRLDAIEERLAQTSPWRLELDPQRALRIAYGRVQIVRTQPDAPPQRSVERSSELPPGVAPEVLAGGPGLVLRGRQPGDAIRLPGGRKLVSDLLIDRKVGREERDALRVLARGSEVLWVEDVAAAEGVATLPVDADRSLMARALAQAARAAELDELPVGAVVARGRTVLAEAHNLTETEHDAGAHAEILAIRAAGRQDGDWRLPGATLYVTLEPCPMCLGAVLQTRIERIVYGAENPREGALGGVLDLRTGAWKRRPEVRAGVLAGESAELLRGFFEKRRARSGAAASEP